MQVTCNKCGTVAFEVSREYAEKEVEEFNIYFSTLSKEDKENYGGKGSSIIQYEYCWCKNSYKNFRDFKEKDCPNGVTLSPIIKRNE